VLADATAPPAVLPKGDDSQRVTWAVADLALPQAVIFVSEFAGFSVLPAKHFAPPVRERFCVWTI
jgi:hypothetical protein